MPNKVLADTNILVEMLRGNEKAKIFLENKPFISVVTEGELVCGAKNKLGLEIVKKTIEFFPKINIDKKISRKAMELLWKYRLSHGLEILDALIAATVLVNKLTLITLNYRDFRFIDEITIMDGSEVI